MTTYQHGGDIQAFAQKLACSVEEVVDLSSNINFVKPDIAVDFNALDIAPYPNYAMLYQSIARHYAVTVDALELFNGGSTAIFRLFDTLGLTQCCIYAPAYLEYKKACEVFHYSLQNIDRFQAFDEEPKEGSLVIFVNPSTPDGMFYPLESLLELWKAKNCTVLVDESFLEFTAYDSVSQYLSDYNNLYILKSMTKFFGAAGIRVGTLLSQPSNIAKLKAKEPLWKLSAFDSAYMQAVLKDPHFKTRSDKLNQQSKAFLLQVLQDSPYIQSIYPTCANYLLVALEGMSAEAFQALLLDEKIMIRSCENFDGLSKCHVRIAVKSIENIHALKKALDA